MSNGKEPFSMAIYWDMLVNEVMNQATLDPETWNTEAIHQFLYGVLKQIQSGIPNEALPEWDVAQKRYRGSREAEMREQGTLVAKGEMLLYGGKYYDPVRLTELNPDSVEKIFADYRGADQDIMTQYQKASLVLSEARLAQDIKQFEVGEARRREELRLGAKEAQAGRVAQFEIERMRRAESLGGQSDWIKRWFAENMENPWIQTRPTVQDTAEEGLWNIRQLQSMAEKTWLSASQAFGSGDYERGKSLMGTVSDLGKALTQIAQDYQPAIQQQQAVAQKGMATGIWPESSRKPTAPPVPAGFPTELVPTMKVGQAGEITKAPIMTPSMQQWQRTPWSGREMLRGYAEWAGGRPYEDIEQHMWSMVPQAPRGGQRWIPRKQWA